MGNFHNLAPPPMQGGAQPDAPARLSPQLIAVEVDVPPFSGGGPLPLPASLVALAQPNPWTYAFLGASQPYAPARLSPVITAVRVDPPPTNYGGPVALKSEVVAVAQPDPWTYSYCGAAQPFGARTLSPGIPGQSVREPPYSYGGPIALKGETVALAQPDLWTFSYFGSAQPFGAKTLSPGIPGQSVREPPYSYGGPYALKMASVALVQPDPWTYSFFNSQPFGAKTLSPAIPGQDVDWPLPSYSGRAVSVLASLITQAQPDPWTYSFFGAAQPFGPKTLSPGIPGQDIDRAPVSHANRGAATAALIARWQPDPWIYTYLATAQPFGAKTLSPAIPGQSADAPPFAIGGPSALKLASVAIAQPDPWVYCYFGAAQPFAKKTLSPGIPGQDRDAPLSAYAGGTVPMTATLVAQAQPDPWTFSFFGALQPFGLRTLSPAIPGQDVDHPPFSHPNRGASTAALISQAQPDRWTYSYFGNAQPFGAKTLSPGIPGQDRDPPLASTPGRSTPVATAVVGQQQPDPWTYLYLGGAGPFMPRLVDAAIPGTSIRPPPFSHPGRGQVVSAIRSAWDPPPPDYEQSLYARIPVPQGIFIDAVPGQFEVGGVTAIFSILEMAATGGFSEDVVGAMLTRDFVNWLPAAPIAAQWTAEVTAPR